MNEKITVHGNPEKSVFGLIGSDVLTDEDKLYIKIENDSKNTGWKEIPPTPTQTPTLSVTPSKTPIVTRQINVSQTPTSTPTPTPTPSIAPTQPLVTPSPTNTPFKTQVNYTIASTEGGTAVRVDGPSPTGVIAIGTGTMQLQATRNDNYAFVRWDAPEGVLFSDAYASNPIAYQFSVSTDVTITAIFTSNSGPPANQTYYVTALTDGSGNLKFDYTQADGSQATFEIYNTTANGYIFNAACASSIGTIYLGTAYLTVTPC